MRNLIRFLALVVAILILIAGGIYGLLASESGSRWLVKMGVSRTLPGMTIDKMGGSLLSGILLNDVRYTTDIVDVRFEKVGLHLDPQRLLQGELHIPQVELSGASFQSAALEELYDKAIYPPLPRWPAPPILIVSSVQFADKILVFNDIEHLMKGFDVRLRADSDGVHVDRFYVSTKELTLSGRGNYRYGQPMPLELWANWSANTPHTEFQISGDSRLAVGENRLRFNHRVKESALMRTSGEIVLDTVSDNQRPFRITAELSGHQLPDAAIIGEGRIDSAGITVTNLKAEMLNGKVIGAGNLHWQPSRQWSFEISGRNLDPAKKWHQWDGDLAIKLHTTGEWAAESYHASVNDLDLAGGLNGLPFQLTGDVHLSGAESAIQVNTLTVAYGQNECTIDGSVGDQLDLKVDAEVRAPETLWTGFRGGQVVAAGRLIGPLMTPAMDVSVNGEGVAYGEYHFDEVIAKVATQVGDLEQTRAHFDLSNVRAADANFSKIWIQYLGAPARHRVQAGISTNGVESQIDLTGQSHDDYWRGELDSGLIRNGSDGDWQLKIPVSVAFNYEEVLSFDSCWTNEGQEKCLTTAWKDKTGLTLAGDTMEAPFEKLTSPLQALFNKKNLGWDKKQ